MLVPALLMHGAETVSDMIALAAEAARRLDYTTEDLEEFCCREGNEKFYQCTTSKKFFETLDLIEFQCGCCSWWKPQIENATPNGDKWVCQECVKSGDFEK